MSDLKHVHVEDRYIKTDRGYLAVSAYVLDSFLGLDWLPDKSIFETNLVLMFVEKGSDGVCVYHSGVMHHSVKTISYIAGLASTLYGAAQGKRPYNPFMADEYYKRFAREYEELRTFREQGYYFGTSLVLRGKVHKSDLLT